MTTPTQTDAWLLAALGFGEGDPVNTLGAADHIMVSYPSEEEWTHACDALGRLGLIEEGTPLPGLTPLGEAIFRPMSRQVVPRQLPKYLLLKIEGLPVVAGPVEPPAREAVREAQAELAQRLQEFLRKERPRREGGLPRASDEGAG